MLARTAALLVATALVSGCVQSFVRAPEPPAWQAWEPVPEAPLAVAVRPGTGLADRLLAGYQRFLRRPARPGQPGCAMEPSCSRYAREAVAAHGTFVGVARTLSRLFFREATSEYGTYQPLQARGEPCRYDPAR